MRKSRAKSKPAQRFKPLHIYLAGCILGIISGITIRPFSEDVHSAVVLLCIGICIFGVYRHFRT